MNKRVYNILFILLFTFSVSFLFMESGYAAEVINNVDGTIAISSNNTTTCSDDGIRAVMIIAGYVVTIVKIIAPLLLIVMGSVDFGKAVISGDDKAMSISLRSFVTRIIAAVIIFFIPTIIKIVLNVAVPDWKTSDEELYACFMCVLDTGNCE